PKRSRRQTILTPNRTAPGAGNMRRNCALRYVNIQPKDIDRAGMAVKIFTMAHQALPALPVAMRRKTSGSARAAKNKVRDKAGGRDSPRILAVVPGATFTKHRTKWRNELSTLIWQGG
ncbi:MAG: hypothetical protein ACJ8ED_03805, partial [Xanthobacteraceae bacterium]